MDTQAHAVFPYWRTLDFLHRLWLFALATSIFTMLGCAQPTRTLNTETQAWSGRIALQIDDQSGQSFSAIFELRGNAQTGTLTLLSPLGNQLAQLDWQDTHVQLSSGHQKRSSDSLNTLMQEVIGTTLPIEAMFNWLQGIQTTTTGWQADLSNIATGRIVARRYEPAPQATLRIVLTR